jgi:hypothetical protein
MTWDEIREKLPDTWVIVEALNAYTKDGYRILHDLSLVAVVQGDGNDAWQCYTHYQKLYQREYYPLHTANEKPVIESTNWRGLPMSDDERAGKTSFPANLLRPINWTASAKLHM